MNHLLNILNSDSINLYGSRFTVGALFEGLYDECIRGTPILVSHDASKLIGWSRPFALYCEPSLTRLAGIGDIAETAEDFELIRNTFKSRLVDITSEFQNEFEELRELLAGSIQGTDKTIYVESVSLVEEDLAVRTFPNLFTNRDKDGLIPLSALNPLGPGAYQIGDLLVFAHSHFRRSMYRLNTLNYPFLKKLQALEGSAAKIALDPHLVGLAATFNGGREELIYWWGPKFDDDLRSIPLGVTRHEAEETERFYFGISSTEFHWRLENDFHVFEAEELPVQHELGLKDKYHCRYVHSMVEEKTGNIDHFDGSIRTYTDAALNERIELDLAHAGRKTEYKKLWRVDGQISISNWKKLLSDYYRDNFLVGEYLGAEKPNPEIWSKDDIKSLQDDYVPYSMEPESGIRLAISIHARSKEADTQIRLVQPFDMITVGSEVYRYVETATLEIKKALASKGADLQIPHGTRYVSFKDRYVNFPVIYHPEEMTQESINETLGAIRVIITSLLDRVDDWVISYNIAFPLDGKRETRISFLGHAKDMAEWLQNSLSYPPITKDGLHEWSENVASFLASNYEGSANSPHVFAVLNPSGILLATRKRVDPNDINLSISDDERLLSWEMLIEPEDEDNLNILLSKGIQPAIGWLIEESKCTKCHQQYDRCNCSKLLENETAQEITKATPFCFWTDRPVA